MLLKNFYSQAFLILFLFGCTDGKVKINSFYGTCPEGVTQKQCLAGSTSYTSHTSGTDLKISQPQMLIPAGYYDGTTSILISDANLSPENIQNGVSVLGITGTANPIPELPTCGAPGQQNSPCKVPPTSYWTNLFGSNLTAWNNLSGGTDVVAIIPAGYYSGGQTAKFSEPSLLAQNIRIGLNVFGVAGSLVPAYPACVDDTFNANQCSSLSGRYVYTQTYGGRSTDCITGLNSSSCWTLSANKYVTPILGTNFSGINGASLLPIPAGYYDGSTQARAVDANLLARNIRQGASVFGVTGSVPEISSGVFTTTSITPHLSSYEETQVYSGNGSTPDLPIGARDIPDVSQDSITGGNVNPVPEVRHAFLSLCGDSQASIDARIADCEAKLGAAAVWDGTQVGVAGNGVWKLVTFVSVDNEVWKDMTTGLLWSSNLGQANWCAASGNNQSTDVTCKTLQASRADSYCAETPSLSGIPIGEPRDASGLNYSSKKGGMGKIPSVSSPAVRWRLPTLADYHQAIRDGLRFVSVGANYRWTATVAGTGGNAAQVALMPLVEYINHNARNSLADVYCVGR